MSDAPEVGIVGLRQFIKELETLGVDVQDLKQAFNRIGNIVVQSARQIAPVRSGRLAESIRASYQKNAATIRVGSVGVPYAGVIHFGWPHRNIEKNPFLYRASEATRDQVVQAVQDELSRLIDQLGLNN